MLKVTLSVHIEPEPNDGESAWGQLHIGETHRFTVPDLGAAHKIVEAFAALGAELSHDQ